MHWTIDNVWLEFVLYTEIEKGYICNRLENGAAKKPTNLFVGSREYKSISTNRFNGLTKNQQCLTH